jgi:hypothetical protein
MSYATIKLIFQKDGCKDDILKITPSEENNTYNVEYTQNTINNVVYSNIAPRYLPQYLKIFLCSVVFDEERGQFVQLEVPSFPTVIVKMAKVLEYYELLVEQIQSIEDNWPTEQTVSSLKKKVANPVFNVTNNGVPFARRPTHQFFDDEEDDE